MGKQRNKNLKHRISVASQQQTKKGKNGKMDSRQSLISPMSVTRRATKSISAISECITPIISNGSASKSNHARFKRRRYLQHNSSNNNNGCEHWKLANEDDDD